MLVAELLATEPTPQTLTELLHEVIDPELGVNIVDLGLLRGVEVDPGGVVRVTTTLTTPACPLGPYITGEIEDLVSQVTTVTQVSAEVVWEPAWDPERDMSDQAKRLLGWHH